MEKYSHEDLFYTFGFFILIFLEVVGKRKILKIIGIL